MSCKIRSEIPSAINDANDESSMESAALVDVAALAEMRRRFVDVSTPLAERMRLLFTFKNIGGSTSIMALADALNNPVSVPK